jgi:pimeloyl-ACP methyl ester carboxylesterase
MFFEAYDRGRLVKLAAERRWVVAAPASSGFGVGPTEDAVRVASAARPVDARRIVLVGHSMGAAVVLQAATAAPERYAAVAAISASGAPRRKFSAPLFFAYGEEDPLVRARSAAAASRPAVTVVAYPDVEHVMIMHSCLDDLFRFVDESFARR